MESVKIKDSQSQSWERRKSVAAKPNNIEKMAVQTMSNNTLRKQITQSIFKDDSMMKSEN